MPPTSGGRLRVTTNVLIKSGDVIDPPDIQTPDILARSSQQRNQVIQDRRLLSLFPEYNSVTGK